MSFYKRFRVKPGHSVRLKKIKPASTGGVEKEDVREKTEKNIERLFKLQYRLYADKRRALLIVLQGMDSSGKDGVIRHVIRGLNPQGCSVSSFKSPSTEESGHDFLWRIHQRAPLKGDVAIFNRSHYEDVLIARVKELVPARVWKERYGQINDFEKMLSDNGTVILKFFLYISKDEQRERLEERLKDPEKNWKFNENDLKERKHWAAYMEAYEDALERCSTKEAPWFIIPSDKKWFRDFVVSEIVTEALEKLDLKLPRPLPDASKIKVV